MHDGGSNGSSRSPQEGTNRWRTVFRPWLLLVLIIGGAAAIRLYHLDQESVWLDEAFAIQVSQRFLGYIVNATAQDVHPPLYYFGLHSWMMAAGTSDAAARGFSVVASLGVLVVAFLLARRLFGEWTALATAGLLAVSPIQIELAQEARMYAWLALLSTLSTLLFSVLLDKPRRLTLACYVVVTAALPYTHVYGFCTLAAHALTIVTIILQRRAGARNVAVWWAAGMGLVALIYLPWTPLLLLQIRHVQQAFWIPTPSWSAFLGAFASYAGTAALGLAWGAAGTLAGRANARAGPRTILLPWLGAQILLPFALSFVGSSIFLPRYTIAASVPFAMLVAAGLDVLRRYAHIGPGLKPRAYENLIVRRPGASAPAPSVRRPGASAPAPSVRRPGALAPAPSVRRPGALAPAPSAAYVCLLVLLLSATVPLRTYFSAPRKDDWREAVAAIERAAAPGDLVLFYKFFNRIPFDNYLRRSDLVERRLSSDIYMTAPSPAVLRYLVRHATTGHNRVWLVLSRGEPVRDHIVSTFGTDFHLTADRSVVRIEQLLFERRQ